MKANAIFFALAAATTASTVSAMNEGEKLVARDANCDFCFERFDFCIKNGHTEGQTGCKQTCVEHVCHVYRSQGHECKDCGGVFDKCREKSRYAF
ncbi:hypothetical protein GT037_002931 [Alternaria burnsii]|uniref:Uncharacterized protein n=1 Tax=Alternaria burnsii TaxID=1187904 RepID=A0A8H7B7P2_9PLEO|nr:uncharacterized protein GT037_002931 [Alternaria burnsii]KAF7679183.1 hypothetical protein GT037_002931 [Alternaria burnsii]